MSTGLKNKDRSPCACSKVFVPKIPGTRVFKSRLRAKSTPTDIISFLPGNVATDTGESPLPECHAFRIVGTHLNLDH